jgi:serine/threonine protein kinase
MVTLRRCPTCHYLNDQTEEFCQAIRSDGDACEVPLVHAVEVELENKNKSLINSPLDTVGSNGKGSIAPLSLQQTESDSSSKTMFGNFPPDLSDRYEVVEEIPARGSEADIFVVSNSAGIELAAKIYRLGINASTEQLLEFADKLDGCSVNLLDHGHANGRDFEIFEYISNGSLADLIEREGPKLSSSRVGEIFKSLLGIVEQLHSADVVHCDLKPDNILVRSEQPVDLVLTDLSLSRDLDDATRLFTSSAGRTLAYAPPEAGSGEASRGFDYWSMGIILIEMLTGQRAFAEMHDAAIQSFLIQEDLDELVEGVDEPWKLLCRGFLRRNSGDRWGSDEARRWLAGDNTLTVLPNSDLRFEELVGPEWASNARSTEDLAKWLMENWNDGVRRLVRRDVRLWVNNVAKDSVSVKILDDAESRFRTDHDKRLFMVIYRLNANLPPVFKGIPIDEQGLAGLHNDEGDLVGDARFEFIEYLYSESILSLYDDLVDRSELGEIEKRWRRFSEEYRSLSSQLVDAGAPETEASAMSKQSLADLLRGSMSDSVKIVERYRREVKSSLSRDSYKCEWFQSLGGTSEASLPKLIRMVELGDLAATETRELRQQRRDQRKRDRRQFIINLYVGSIGALTGSAFMMIGAWLGLTIVAGLWSLSDDPPDFLTQMVELGTVIGGIVGAYRGAKNGVRHPAQARSRGRMIIVLTVIAYVGWQAGAVPWFEGKFEGINTDFQVVDATPAVMLDRTAGKPVQRTTTFEQGHRNFAYSLTYRGAVPNKTDISIYLAQVSPTRSRSSMKTCNFKPSMESGWVGCELSNSQLTPGTYVWLLNYKTPFRKMEAHQTTFTVTRAPDPLVLGIQEELKRLGYSIGITDGIYGPRTKRAIQQFQSKNRHTADGKVSQSLLNMLRRQ